MTGEYDEESLQHIYALLQKHKSTDLVRMVLDVAETRLSATSSLSRLSQFSGNSIESRVSAVSTDYAPTRPSSTSSGSRPPRDFLSYRSGLDPTKPGPLRMYSTPSEVLSPTNTLSISSPVPWDFDNRSIASSASKRSKPSTSDGIWFCTFCSNHKSFAAKSDWKKHEERHHETGQDWPCPIRNCFKVFDREANFVKHCQLWHPDIPPPTDIKILLLDRVVYGCGFDGCKAILAGWRERCNHVADLHMKKERRNRSDWKYSNVIHNLLRQDATRSAWKSLFAGYQLDKPRHQITWAPENSRVLKQKLECSDMRPSVDVVLHIALSLREGRPFNDVVELDPAFKTPSQDSVPTLTAAELSNVLKGTSLKHVPAQQPISSMALASDLSRSTATSFVEPHPGTLVEFNTQTFVLPRAMSMTYIDTDQESLMSLDEPDPQIPPGLDLGPSHMEPVSTPRPFETQSSQSPDNPESDFWGRYRQWVIDQIDEEIEIDYFDDEEDFDEDEEFHYAGSRRIMEERRNRPERESSAVEAA
ncbi:hypothetical protein BCR34DRAFT_610397 [Clohesyomyces aquaticus]|uniref:C2H2-type domain-containing protein n=1 Tax=Clohesyomyces aquaticus TaxID=1231657 RepID=A0A1Y2A7W4_9PLEO|nr:hypothetical protein BCR34DRAFT_610397 [Clohesyomyces aquaticus]